MPGKRPSRKSIYLMVAAGMPVARVGRRMHFCAEWVDGYLVKQAEKKRTPAAGKAAGAFENTGRGHEQDTESAGTDATAH